ncbi:hypothetical protein [Membranihabitans maritimus]|uniref:hypothetical protein n=1 Tax=Membranihabitans maritimus TaxID=2904244 RepID=UPI001F1634E0|nr:hypothetical protein [Membranihabitans maritimus]
MKSIIIILFFLYLQPYKAYTQVFLQLEKIGNTKTLKIPVGSEIEFKLKGRDYYTKEKITGFRPDQGVVITESEVFFADSIYSIIPNDFYHRKGRFFIYPLYTLGATGTLSGIIGTIYEKRFRAGLLLPGPIVFGIAWLLHQWIDRPYVANKGWRFRVVDLRMSVPEE